MTAKQLRRALDKLGLSQLGLARLMRVSPRQVRRWVSDEEETAVPYSVELLLRLLMAERISTADFGK